MHENWSEWLLRLIGAVAGAGLLVILYPQKSPKQTRALFFGGVGFGFFLGAFASNFVETNTGVSIGQAPMMVGAFFMGISWKALFDLFIRRVSSAKTLDDLKKDIKPKDDLDNQ